MMILTEATIIHTVIQTPLEGMGTIEDTPTIMITPIIITILKIGMMRITGTAIIGMEIAAMVIIAIVMILTVTSITVILIHDAAEGSCTLKKESVIHTIHTMILITPDYLLQITTPII